MRARLRTTAKRAFRASASAPMSEKLGVGRLMGLLSSGRVLGPATTAHIGQADQNRSTDGAADPCGNCMVLRLPLLCNAAYLRCSAAGALAPAIWVSLGQKPGFERCGTQRG